MFYSIVHDSEFRLDCKRCGRPLAHAVKFLWDGELITVGRECARHYGITWTEKVGPMADDPEVFAKAIEIHRSRTAKNNYAWPGGWEACQPIKEALGSVAWKRAAEIAIRRK